jgi:hypothetical protein
MTAYWRERFPLRLFLPVAAALAIAAGVGVEGNPGRTAADTACASMLLAQFRLWDDLADLESDRRNHPDRVLAAAPDTTPFVATCVWLAILNLLVAALRAGVLGACLTASLDAAAAIWYTARPTARTAATDLARLTKYPIFVLLLASAAGPLSSRLALSAGATYLAACVYEIWHDAAGPMRITR